MKGGARVATSAERSKVLQANPALGCSSTVPVFTQARGAGVGNVALVVGEEGDEDVLDDDEEELESAEGAAVGRRASPAGQQTR